MTFGGASAALHLMHGVRVLHSTSVVHLTVGPTGFDDGLSDQVGAHPRGGGPVDPLTPRPGGGRPNVRCLGFDYSLVGVATWALADGAVMGSAGGMVGEGLGSGRAFIMGVACGLAAGSGIPVSGSSLGDDLSL